MKAFTLIIIILISFSFNGNSCCSAGQYRLFPLGSSMGKLVVVEFKLKRYCVNGEGRGENNQFNYKGVINLAYYEDSTLLINNIDTIDFTACTCEYRTESSETTLSEKLLPFYQKALDQAKKLPNFIPANPITYTYHDRNEKINGMWFENDENPEFHVKNKIVQLKPINWAACGYLNRIIEVRTYEIATINYTFITLTCDSKHHMPKEKIEENKQHFKVLKNSFTYQPSGFHGMNRDYILKN